MAKKKQPPAITIDVAGVESSNRFGNNPSTIDWERICGLPKFQAFALDGARIFYPNGQFRPLPEMGESVSEVRVEEVKDIIDNYLNEISVRTLTIDNIRPVLTEMLESTLDHMSRILESNSRQLNADECYVSIGNVELWLTDYMMNKISQVGEHAFLDEYSAWHDSQTHYAKEDIYGNIKG